MKVSYLISFVLIAMLVGACSDQTRRTHTISGNVFFEDDMRPMSDILISIYQENGKDGFQSDLLGSNQLTAADGGYSFDIQPFKNGEATDVLLSSSATSTINLGFNSVSFAFPVVFEEIPITEILEDEDYQVDLLGEPFGFLDIQFAGNNDLFVDDAVKLTVSAAGYSYRVDLGASDNLRQNFRFPVRGEAKTNVEWESTISGITRTDSDSVFCDKRANTAFRITL